MIARVRAVTAAATARGSMLKVRGSMSTNAGHAPTWRMAFAVAMQVNAGQITSSPGPTPLRCSAICIAEVHELVATACSAPIHAASRCSNSTAFGPWLTHPERMTGATALASRSS